MNASAHPRRSILLYPTYPLQGGMSMLIWELLGAIVGAGFASGREIASFFAQHHPWGYAGSILAAVSIVWLVDTKLPASWRNHWPEWACKVLIVLMLLATGGAMLSGAGEISSMLLPLKHAYWIGSVFTLMVAWLMADSRWERGRGYGRRSPESESRRQWLAPHIPARCRRHGRSARCGYDSWQTLLHLVLLSFVF